MCNCINDTAKLIEEKNPKHFKKPISFVTINSFSLSGDYFVDYRVYLEGQKKTESVSIKMNYCPFCGEKLTSEVKHEPTDK